jgi:thymidylate synthase
MHFIQITMIINICHNPLSRRIMTNIYNHGDLNEMHLYPCAYSMTFNVSGDTLNGILNQRSQDMLAANNWNVCQYSILLMMLAQASGLKCGELVHVIADAHIYDRHIPIIEDIISFFVVSCKSDS